MTLGMPVRLAIRMRPVIDLEPEIPPQLEYYALGNADIGDDPDGIRQDDVLGRYVADWVATVCHGQVFCRFGAAG